VLTRRLHIGALQPFPGWETLNAQPLPSIDHVGDAADLSRFPDNTFEALYASHVLEHFDYRDAVLAVLKEWHRVITPGGRLFVSVPDLDIIARMICDRVRFTAQDRFNCTRMLLGGHVDPYDYHKVLFNEEILAHFLLKAGFDSVLRGAEFGFFDDTSSMRFKGELISLNLVAVKPAVGDSATVAALLNQRTEQSTPPSSAETREVSFSITRYNRSYHMRYLFDTTRPTQQNMAAHLLNGSLYEPEVAVVLMRVLQDGDGFVDVGANVGFFTVLAAQLVGETGRVYAFEPEQENFGRLAQNISLNDLSNVVTYQSAVGDQVGTAELFINSDNDGGHALWNPGAHSFNKVSREKVIKQNVEMVTLDSVLAGATVPVKLIKIDAEGYEQHVLHGALELITRHRVPFVLAEVNRLALQQAGASERALFQLMRHLGYFAYLVEVTEPELTSTLLEIPLHFIPQKNNPEMVYNVCFSFPETLKDYGLMN
jgi:FkbM family methyltransferase